MLWKSGTAELHFDLAHARVLQAKVAGQSAFWNPVTLAQPWNVGGDRLWLGKEIDWFWAPSRPEEPPRYIVQTPLDPGSWRTVRADDHLCAMEQDCELTNLRTGETSAFRIQRAFIRAARDRTSDITEGIAYVTEQRLEILRGPKGQPVGFWNLVQVPLGGVARVPCRHGAWRSYFEGWSGDSARTIRRIGGALEIRVTDDMKFKVGIGAADAFGVITYTREVEGGSLTVRREFWPQPWHRYIDVPRTEAGTEGDAVQIYSDGGRFGHFGELEHHSPSIACGSGPQTVTESYLTEILMGREAAAG